jgi:hypothetical protein
MVKIFGNIELGMQPFCFRKFTNEQIVEELQDCGLSALEICKKHLNLEAGDDSASVLKLYQDKQIRYNSFGPYCC